MNKQENCDECRYRGIPVWKDVVGGIAVLVIAGMLAGVTVMQNTVAVNTSDIATLKKVNESTDARAIRIEQKLDNLTMLMMDQNKEKK